MPVLGEIIGTTAGDVLGRARRRMGEGFVQDAEERDQIARANLALRAAEIEQAERRLQAQEAADRAASITQVSTYVAKALARAPEERRVEVLDQLLQDSPPEIRVWLGNRSPQDLMNALTPDEVAEVVAEGLPLGQRALLAPAMQAYFKSMESLLAPVDKELVSQLTDRLQKEVEGGWFGWGGLKSEIAAGKHAPDSQPSRVHRLLGLHLRDLPITEINESHYHAAAVAEFAQQRQRGAMTGLGTVMEEILQERLGRSLGYTPTSPQQEQRPRQETPQILTPGDWWKNMPAAQKESLVAWLRRKVEKEFGLEPGTPEHTQAVNEGISELYEESKGQAR